MEHLIITIKVTFDANGETTDTLREQLSYAAQRLAGEGLLSGETAALVDTWSYEVALQSNDTGETNYV